MTGPLEHRNISQHANEVLGLEIRVQGAPADPDGSTVTVTMTNTATSVVVFTRAATRVDVGRYEVTLSTAESSVLGTYALLWQYAIAGVAQGYQTEIVIGSAEPAYDTLAEPMQIVVDNVSVRFADLFDSPHGGPHLQTYFQSHFNRGRIAQLLRVAVGVLNTTAQPFQSYTIDGDGGASFPINQWGPLLEQALYVEVVKHLIRSYVEQPLFQGGGVTRLDRRDYMDRWRAVLDDERDQLRSQLEVFKIANMGLGKPKVLVSGGVYGRFGPTRYAGMAARPRYFYSFYS